MLLTPSIASSNLLELKTELRKLGSWPRLHIDIEDGNFVPNITFGLKTVLRIAAASIGNMLDVHLLVTSPMDFVQPLAECGIQAICSHIEPLRFPLIFLNAVHSLGMKAGLAINIKTPVDELLPFADLLDYVLIMTAEPDGADECFYIPALNKLRIARKKLPGHVRLHVDGGIGPDTLTLCADAGADESVLGRASFCTEDHFAQLCTLSALLD